MVCKVFFLFSVFYNFTTICIECGFLLILPSWGLWPPDYEYLHIFFFEKKIWKIITSRLCKDWFSYFFWSWHSISYYILLLKLLKVKVKSLSRVWLFVTLWTVAYQASLSMGFSRQEYWSGLPFPSPGDLPDAGTEPMSLVSPTLACGFFTTSITWEALIYRMSCDVMWKSLSHVQLFVTHWTKQYMEFSRWEYWSG